MIRIFYLILAFVVSGCASAPPPHHDRVHRAPLPSTSPEQAAYYSGVRQGLEKEVEKERAAVAAYIAKVKVWAAGGQCETVEARLRASFRNSPDRRPPEEYRADLEGRVARAGVEMTPELTGLIEQAVDACRGLAPNVLIPIAEAACLEGTLGVNEQALEKARRAGRDAISGQGRTKNKGRSAPNHSLSDWLNASVDLGYVLRGVRINPDNNGRHDRFESAEDRRINDRASGSFGIECPPSNRGGGCEFEGDVWN